MRFPLVRDREVYRSTALTLFGTVAIQAMLLVSGLLAARMLGVANRGHLALYFVFVMIFTQVGGLGLSQATTYWIARDRSLARHAVRATGRLIVAQSVVAVGVQATILAVVFGRSTRPVQLAAAISVIGTPALLAHQYVLGVLQGQRRFRAFSGFRFLPSALYSSALLIIFFSTAKPPLALVTGAWIVSLVGTASVGLYVMLRGLPAKSPDGAGSCNRNEMVRFGLKGLLGSIAPLETFNLDQAIVGLVISPVALGLYVVGLAFTNLPQFLAQSLGHVAYPHVAAEQNVTTARRSMWRFVAATLALSGTAALLLGLAAPWLVTTLFGRAYASSATLTRILLVGALFIGLRRVLTDGARGLGRPAIGTVAELVSLVSLGFGLALLVSGDGVEGAAWAVSLASVAGFVFLAAAVMFGPKVPTRLIVLDDIHHVTVTPNGDLLDAPDMGAKA